MKRLVRNALKWGWAWVLVALLLAPMVVVVTTTKIEGAKACSNGVQVGQAVVVFEQSDWGRTGIEFHPPCSGDAVLFVTATGELSPGEVATGQVLGPGVGAVSLALPFVYTGNGVVSWMVVPAGGFVAEGGQYD